jgi:hypothetical protein
MPTAKEWQALVDPHFGFLRSEYECAITGDPSDEHWTLRRVVYQNTTTAVAVDFSDEFQCVEVQLVRLVDGQRPPYPIFISAQPLLHHFLLDGLLQLRAPELLEEIKPHFSLEPEEVEAQLSLWARGLKAFGADILRGHFSVFEVLESRLREVARRSPEQMTAWVPHTRNTPDDRVLDQLRAQLQRDYPTIPLVIREYSVSEYSRKTPLGRLRQLIRRMLARA